MGKSTIPFIFDNPYLNNIFIEAASCTQASKYLCFKKYTLEEIKKNSNFKILVLDNSSLIKIVNQDIKLDSIFVVNETNQTSINLKTSPEVIKINIPFKMSDIFQRIEKPK